MSESFGEAVEAIYDWVDEEVRRASPRCEISGRCCRFREYGHRLYISRVEADRLLQAPLPENVLPEDLTLEQLQAGCVYQRDGRCTAREYRPLGCRIFFCDPAFEEKSCEITEEALRRLKNLCEKHERGWEYQELAVFVREWSEQQSLPRADSRVDSKSSP